MKIGLDLDGVCYKFESTARYMLRRRMLDRGETPPIELSEVSQYWDWIKTYSTKADWAWLWSGAIEEGLYRYGHVVTGAIEGAQAISRLGSTTVITARPKGAVHDTMAWLELMLNRVPLAGVVIQSDGQKKSEVPSIDVYIDDAKHNLEELLDNTDAHVIQFVQPWNKDFEAKHDQARRHLRAYSWTEVVGWVTRLKENGI